MLDFIFNHSSIIIPVFVFIIIVLVVLIAKAVYKKAPPNVAMVITGPSGTKTVVGKASIVIPIIQRVDYMSLENIQVDFTSKDEIPTRDAINILVDAVANISISKDPELMKIASSKFLGYTTEDIQKIVTPVLEGNIREIISQTTLKSLIQGDKKELAEKVVENVTPNLRDMGLDLTTFNIQNFKDRNGVIDNLGIQNTVQISKDAAISKADAESEIAIKQAEAAKRANDARVSSDLEIAKRQNELSIRKAELKKQADIKDAEAEAAKGIQQEEQRKTLEITTAEANLAKQEKEIELKEREVTIKERTLEAEVKKTAEAQKYAKQQEADASLYETQRQSEAELFERQKKAEAEKFEAQQKAEANKALAEAQKYAKQQEAEAIRVAGLAEAEAISAKGRAEAEAIKAKAEAEAEGLMKKAEAMAAYGDAAKQDMQLQALKVYFEQLPDIARGVAEGYSKVDKINIYGGDSAKLQSDLINNVTQISEGLTESMGIDLKGLLSGMLGAKIIDNTNKEESDK
jgi:flotillin